MGQHNKALELGTQVYELLCKVLGEEHPDTLNALNDLAYIHFNLKEYKESAKIFHKLYNLRYKILGKNNPATKAALKNFINVYKASKK